MSLKVKFFLIIPLIAYLDLWLSVVFNIQLTPDWLFYNTEPHPEDPPQQGVLPDSLIIVWVFFGVPLSFFVGSIYTAYKKLWRWFWAYMIIGGLPVGIFSIAVYLG
ncbi:hypothetical protein [Vibrio ostreicida]|uniref:hypothetical protein n=1 Tax=Vibrio ostreicida TaxID=526588 RepID=UPI000970FEE8|nr:hypothetical protein [Vibrio ostreicida]